MTALVIGIGRSACAPGREEEEESVRLALARYLYLSSALQLVAGEYQTGLQLGIHFVLRRAAPESL